MNKNFLRKFKNPGKDYRGAPFWAWNGKLDPEELRRQVRIMHRMGLGGFFMHSRSGLATKYLSKEWMKCIGACVDEAEKLNMNAWLYDEDRWPSGAAGGLVTKNPKYRQQSLIMQYLNHAKSLKWTPDIVAVFTAHIQDSQASHVQQISKGQHPLNMKANEKLVIFRVEPSPCSDSYNGFTYLDTLSREAVKKFLEVTHEAYRKNMARYFGKQIPGIFTDEPNYGTCCSNRSNMNKTGTPWTARLPSVFKTRYGYDLIPHLPELFFDIKGIEMSRARYHYHDCITFLFVDAFSKQIGQWCRKNKLLFTGHVLAEQSLSSQTAVVGSCMRFYEYMQAPGMDLLTEHQREYDTAIQVSSAARQFGRKWRLTETYGCTGWDFSFAGHKALGDWQAALGINLRCQHLAWYTMEGKAKRDYPASIFFQSPWWELYPKVEDYFARIHAVMTQGKEVRDLLVIHPNESMWTFCKLGWKKDKKVQNYDLMLIALRDSLLEENIGFDYGDEEILSRHGRIRTIAGVPTLFIGKASYKTVVAPPLATMRQSTLEILRKFHSAGGAVVFAGKPAEYIDAVPSEAVRNFATTCTKAPAQGKALASAVESLCRRVSITDRTGREIGPALHLLREDQYAFYLFICNTGHKCHQLIDRSMVRDRTTAFKDVFVRGFSICKGNPLEFDPDTGSITSANAVQQKENWEIRTSLPPLGSRLFVIPKQKQRKLFPLRKAYREVRKKRLVKTRWGIVLSESNNLVLDYPRYRIGRCKWQSAKEILRVDRTVQDRLGIVHRGIQPWAQKRTTDFNSIPVQLAYQFDVKVLPSDDIQLAMEQPGRFQIAVNGINISTDIESGWWTDTSLRTIPIDPALFHIGQNKIVLSCNYDRTHPGLEIIYLRGSFGVRLRGTRAIMTTTPSSLKLGDWCRQGLPFYSGSVSYMTSINPKLRKGERLFLKVPSYRGVAVRILVNGKSVGVMAWEPNEKDITDYLTGQKTELRIEVIGHRRNSHGPLHINKKWPYWTGPKQFSTTGKGWQDAYQLVPCGLMNHPWISVMSGKQVD